MGRRQWESLIATAARQSVQNTIVPVTVNVGVGASFTVDLFSPAGTIGIVQSMYLDSGTAPSAFATATTGDHQMSVTTSAQSGAMIYAKFNFDKPVYFNRLQWSNFLEQQPNDYAAVVMALKGIYFDSTTALRLSYVNATDKAFSGVNMTWRVTWLKIESA